MLWSLRCYYRDTQKLCQKVTLISHLSSLSEFFPSLHITITVFFQTLFDIIWSICFNKSLSSESSLFAFNLFRSLLFGIFSSSLTFKISRVYSWKIFTFVLTNSRLIHSLIDSIVHLILKQLNSLFY